MVFSGMTKWKISLFHLGLLSAIMFVYVLFYCRFVFYINGL